MRPGSDVPSRVFARAQRAALLRAAFLLRRACLPQNMALPVFSVLCPIQRIRFMRSASPASANRFAYIDVLKAFASSLIVLHHLAFYGPMADHAHALAPELIDWLASQGRLAVQVFLVVGGFLAAKSLTATRIPPPAGEAIRRRFYKLVPPYLLAILCAIVCAALARVWMPHSSIPAAPTAAQIVAHALLLQDILDVDSLSAGLWYIAIDFQLYAGMAILAAMTASMSGRFYRALLPVVVTGCALVSLLYVNRHPEWDVWGAYFFGSYAFGALAWWAASREAGARQAAFLTGTVCVIGVIALAIDFRTRILLALLVSLALIAGSRFNGGAMIAKWCWPAFFGRISYALLLVHFPVCMVVNAFFYRYVAPDPAVQLMGMMVAWAGSIVAAAAFHHWVEQPLARGARQGDYSQEGRRRTA
jgi:peptidoglycan/LPS O-acetylase OafA/YrhL